MWLAARGTRHATHAMRHVHAPCTEYHTPPAMHFTPCAIHRSYTMRHGTMHHAPCNIHHTHTPRSVQWRPCTAHREPNNEHHVHMHPRLTALHARSITCDSECGSSETDATRHGMHAAAAAVCCTPRRIFSLSPPGCCTAPAGTGRMSRDNCRRRHRQGARPASMCRVRAREPVKRMHINGKAGRKCAGRSACALPLERRQGSPKEAMRCSPRGPPPLELDHGLVCGWKSERNGMHHGLEPAKGWREVGR